MCLNSQEKTEIQGFLREHLHRPVWLHTYARNKTLRDHFVTCDTHSEPVRRFAADLAALSPHITLSHSRVRGLEEVPDEAAIKWLPAIRLVGTVDHHIRYYGMPTGYEVSAFLRALALTAGAPLTISRATQQALSQIETEVDITIFVTPECFLCPMAAHLANQFAVANPHYIRTNIVNATQFPELVQHYGVRGVPRIIINEGVHHTGIPDEHLLLRLVRQMVGLPVH
jgi:alkyl hydroperoxide reductase subunit AhpF